jgi:Rnl2 family RNA ligase
VPKVQGAIKCQKHIYYSPENKWMCFDIGLRLSDEEYLRYLSGNEYRELLKQFDLPYLTPLFVGSFDQAVAYSNEFSSTIATTYYGLPPLEDNICEGIVIKPIISCRLGNGDRVALKSKNPKFSEKSKEHKPKVPIEMKEETKVIFNALMCLLNENRVNSAISKIGQVSGKDFGKLVGAVTQDIIKEYEKDNQQLSYLEDYHLITKSLGKEIATFIKTNFLDIFK